MQENATSARVTFRGNLERSRHGWLRLTPAYSVELVERLVDDLPARARVLDPFCGSGTTLLTCAERGVGCSTVDLNPFLVWLANSKAGHYSEGNAKTARVLVERMAKKSIEPSRRAPWLPPISNIDRWWSRRSQAELGHAFSTLSASKVDAKSKQLAAICFCRALIAGARVSFGHQSMSFKTGSKQAEPEIAELLRAADRRVIESARTPLARPQETALLGDARQLGRSLGRRRFDAVITSPPYCNRMSYIRELRPYMYWLGHLDAPSSAGDLDWRAIGGTWGVATSRLKHWQPTRPAFTKSRELERLSAAILERSSLLGRYVQRYFSDMAEHLASLRPLLKPRAKVHYVIGNSKFYDVMLPTEQLLATQLEEAGFTRVQVETLRTRTSKSELYEFLVTAHQP